jgi:hypothetical protein
LTIASVVNEQELIKHTDEAHVDYPHLQEAFGKIEAVVTSVNEKKQADEDREVIARIISRLSNTEVHAHACNGTQSAHGRRYRETQRTFFVVALCLSPQKFGVQLMVPGRRLVQEGRLMEVAKDRSESFRRRFFLFTDLLILAEDRDKPGCTSLSLPLRSFSKILTLFAPHPPPPVSLTTEGRDVEGGIHDSLRSGLAFGPPRQGYALRLETARCSVQLPTVLMVVCGEQATSIT